MNTVFSTHTTVFARLVHALVDVKVTELSREARLTHTLVSTVVYRLTHTTVVTGVITTTHKPLHASTTC